MAARRKKTLRQRLRDDLDKVVADIVKYRDGYQCYCGSRLVPQAGHYIGRSNYALRWHLLNVHCQCRTCNGAHNNPALTYRYTNWIIARFGVQAHKNLMLLADTKTEPEWTTTEMKDELEKLREVHLKLTTAGVFDDKRLFEMGLWGDDILTSPPSGPTQLPWRLLK